MITVMRKHHKWLMIVIAILAIPFIFYFNKSDFTVNRDTDLGRIYDRPVTNVEFQRSVRLLTLAQTVGLSQLVQDLMMRPMSENDAYVNFAFNRLVLDHEAEALGVKPTNQEVVAFVKTLIPFQNNGAFDPAKYTEFVKTRLPAMGFTEAQLEELVTDQLTLNRVKDLLGAGLHVADSETAEYYEQAYGKLHVAVIRFREEDFQKDVKVTDEDIARYYEARKAEFKTDEKRKIEFVAFPLGEAEKKLAGKERIDALQKVANRANEFVQAMLEKDAKFAEVAAKFNVPVVATGEFAATAPDPALGGNAQLAQYAFQLKQEEPVSDALQGADSFYVLHLLGSTPSRPLTLDEAKPKITEALTKEKLKQAIATRGNDVSRTIREAAKANTPFDKALAQMGLQAERIPPFSIIENPTPTPAPATSPAPPKPDEPKKPDIPDLASIKNSVRELNPGDASDFIPTPKGGLVTVLETRDPGDPAGFETARTNFEKNYLQSKKMVVFDEWLHDRRKAAGLQPTVAPTTDNVTG
jgi:hypothetical protein